MILGGSSLPVRRLPAHRWVYRLIRLPDTLFNHLFECSNTSPSCHRPGAKLESHPAKSRQESGGVRTVICPGKQHFANLLDSSRPGRGLPHTEEVTGSIPVSPTDVRPAQRLYRQLSSYAADGSCRRIGSNSGDRALRRVIGFRRAEGFEQPGQPGPIIAVESDCVVQSAERRQQREPGASELGRSPVKRNLQEKPPRRGSPEGSPAVCQRFSSMVSCPVLLPVCLMLAAVMRTAAVRHLTGSGPAGR